ncbi:unnamed protein product, partial [Rotaria sp. Silwood1]
ELIPSFGYDLAKHCLKRNDTLIAYPIEICISLLENSLNEQGLFRIASSQGKQKKLVAELNLHAIDRGRTLYDLNYDPHVPASTLKQYLRELPDCLLTNALLSQWNDVISISILYGKDQSSSQQSISNSYAAASTILELIIIHHKQLFTNSSEQEQTSKSLKCQPDLIPTEFHSKSQSVSNENLLDIQSTPGYLQPSPGTHRKNKAPRPPTTSSINQQTSVEQLNYENISSGTQLDRPGAPSPLPPSLLISTSPTVQPRQKLSFPLLKTNNEQKFSTTIEDKTIEHESTTDLSTDSTSTTNDGVNVGKSNNNRISSFRNSTLPSPGNN